MKDLYSFVRRPPLLPPGRSHDLTTLIDEGRSEFSDSFPVLDLTNGAYSKVCFLLPPRRCTRDRITYV